MKLVVMKLFNIKARFDSGGREPRLEATQDIRLTRDTGDKSQSNQLWRRPDRTEAKRRINR